jgi:hypothetical protein
MFFGIGFGELFLGLLLLALPVFGIVLVVRLVQKALGPKRTALPDPQIQEIVAELQRSHVRIEELEARITQLDEQASFTQELLLRPRVSGTSQS